MGTGGGRLVGGDVWLGRWPSPPDATGHAAYTWHVARACNLLTDMRDNDGSASHRHRICGLTAKTLATERGDSETYLCCTLSLQTDQTPHFARMKGSIRYTYFEFSSDRGSSSTAQRSLPLTSGSQTHGPFPTSIGSIWVCESQP